MHRSLALAFPLAALAFLCLAIVIPSVILIEKYYLADKNNIENNAKDIIVLSLLVIVPFIVYNIIPGLHVNRIAGVFSGFLAGAYLAREKIVFNPSNTILSNIIKIAIGLTGLFIIRSGLKLVLPAVPVSGFFRYWIMGFWFTFAAPLIFSKLDLLKGEAVVE